MLKATSFINITQLLWDFVAVIFKIDPWPTIRNSFPLAVAIFSLLSLFNILSSEWSEEVIMVVLHPLSINKRLLTLALQNYPFES